MPGQRQDYLLSQIELLRQFVARLVHSRDPVGLTEALQLAFSIQEKLFPLPVAEFLGLDVDEQLAALRSGESPASGQEKCVHYAQLLQSTAELYDFRGRTDLAVGARHLALHVALVIALTKPEAPLAATQLVQALRPHLDPDILHPPVRELLHRYEVGSS